MKCHIDEAQPSRDTKGRRDEEQIIIKQTPHMKPQTQKLRRTTTEEPPWNDLGRVSRKLLGVLNQFYSRETSPLSSNAAPNI